MRHRRMIGTLFGAMVALLAFAGAAHATTRTVTKTGDSDDGMCTVSLCSVRDAVKYASAGDKVVVPPKAAHYAVTMGEIPITVAPLTIQGASASSSVIDATGCSCRVFHATAPLSVNGLIAFQKVTITGGSTSVKPGGGAMLVDGSGTFSVSLNGAVVRQNTVSLTGGPTNSLGGGGIYNNTSGSTSLQGASVTHNAVTVTGVTTACCHGGGGVYGNAGQINVTAGSHVENNTVSISGDSSDTNKCCGGGGGIFQDANRAVTVSASTVSGNHVTTNVGSCCYGGGGLFDLGNSSTSATLTNSTLDGNTVTVTGPSFTTSADQHCCSGGGAVWTIAGLSATGTTFSGNQAQVTAGDCCHGGGAVYDIHANSPSASAPGTFSSSTVHANTTSVNGSGGASGGGGIYFSQHGGPLAVNRSTIDGNQANVSAVLNSGGGGVWAGGHATDRYTNSTISGNFTNAAAKAEGGGGIYRSIDGADPGGPGTDILANVTLARNSAPSGGGGGIYNFSSTVKAKNSIVALNTAGNGNNCYNGGTGPVFTSLGYNLEDSPDTCSFTAAGDKVVPSSSVGLGPLASNGGPTQTRALLAGSAAIDAGNPAGCTDPLGALLATDQRGLKRPSNGRCDIGAFELQFGAAKCTLKAKSSKILLHPKKKQKRLKGALQLTVRCDQAITIALSGNVREKKKHGKKGKGKSISLKRLNKTVPAGITTTIILKLPKKALSALTHHVKESVNLALTATNANGKSTTRLKIKRLQLRKH